jgi:hypothetical protein
LLYVFILYRYVVCLEREEQQNEDKTRKLGKGERIWKNVIRREMGGNKVGSRKRKKKGNTRVD